MLQFENLNRKQVSLLAKALAKEFQNLPLTLGLIGPLGAGKTLFIKSFAQALGVNKISSPTFTIAHRHKLAQRFLYHLDFYRLSKKSQLRHLGLDEIIDGRNIVLIEWADKFPEVKKRCDILISLALKPDNKRDVTIQNL